MKRITPLQKTIADRHIAARMNRHFDFIKGTNPKLKLDDVSIGRCLTTFEQTFEDLHEAIEDRYCSIGSQMMVGIGQHASKTYTADCYKGWKTILNRLDIK